MIVKPFAPMEKALRAFIQANFAPVSLNPELVGRDLPGDVTDIYIRIEKFAGNANRLEGDFVFDVEVFSPSYNRADSVASDLDALLLGYPHRVELEDRTVIFDSVGQNKYPSEIPWDDDRVHRLQGTYVITARR